MDAARADEKTGKPMGLIPLYADSDESGHRFRLKADSVPIDCGQHSDDPGHGALASTAGWESRGQTGVKA
jgi:hypothetical protein